MNEKDKKAPKTYHPPRLKEYGSIRKITRSLGDKHKTADGVKGKFNKT